MVRDTPKEKEVMLHGLITAMVMVGDQSTFCHYICLKVSVDGACQGKRAKKYKVALHIPNVPMIGNQ